MTDLERIFGDQSQERTILDQPENTDWALAHWVYMAETFGLSVGVTLFLGGMVIAGTIYSEADYFEDVGARVLAAEVTLTGERKDVDVAGGLAKWLGIYREGAKAKVDRRQADEPGEYEHIHLKDARIITPVSDRDQSPGPGNPWRGKLSAVDGFMVGKMT